MIPGETPPQLRAELETLAGLTAAELAARYEQVFGEPPHSRNVAYLRKRVAWGIQSKFYGETLSEQARRRAREIARLSDLRLTAPEPDHIVSTRIDIEPRCDPKLPPAGTLLVRPYKGREIRVTILDTGVDWNGVVYPSLSAAANAITGQHVSGPAFFGLTRRRRPT